VVRAGLLRALAKADRAYARPGHSAGLVASLYPFGLAVVLLLAEAERYKGRLTVILAGAATCTLAIGFAVVFALHRAKLGQSNLGYIPRI
jgi:hypothetical protein